MVEQGPRLPDVLCKRGNRPSAFTGPVSSLKVAMEIGQMQAPVLVAQSCPPLWRPMDCSPPGSSVHGIFQARILGWVPVPSPGGRPDPGIEPWSLALQAYSFPAELPGKLPNTSHLSTKLAHLHSTLLTLEARANTDMLPPNHLFLSSLQRRPSWATTAACTWRSSCPWSCTPRQRTCPSASCPSELTGCWWPPPPGTLPTPCVWSWTGGVSSSWLT